MSVEKFTPGPWRAASARKASNFGNFNAHVTASVPSPVKGETTCGLTVARVSGTHGASEREACEANARLIARRRNRRG